MLIFFWHEVYIFFRCNRAKSVPLYEHCWNNWLILVVAVVRRYNNSLSPRGIKKLNAPAFRRYPDHFWKITITAVNGLKLERL